MAEIVVELKGFDEAIAWLERAPETANSLFAEAVERGLQAIAGRVKAYPPATEANRPGRVTRDGRPMGYYERGQGWWYPVKQAKTLGGVRLKSAGVRPLGRKAAKQMGAVGYKLIRSSERLREHWTTRIEKQPDGVEGVIGTGVSYAGAGEPLAHDEHGPHGDHRGVAETAHRLGGGDQAQNRQTGQHRQGDDIQQSDRSVHDRLTRRNS